VASILAEVPSRAVSSRSTDVAIIGMACRYPKADSPEILWSRLLAGEDLSEATPVGAQGRVGRQLILPDIESFDHAFFGYTPHESRITDPQHRIMLTCAYRALEDAGYERIPQGLRVGVFASTSISTYLLNVILRSPHFDPADNNYPILLGNDKDALATRIAYKLDLKGPAITIQCACSSSLVAIHYACQSLLAGESDLAIVGAVSITIPQQGGLYYKRGGILSADGYCRPFDKSASGTVKGNGCGAVILRRVNDALDAGENVRALIRGTAVNNDGAEKIGFTAPSISGQRSVIEEALSYSGVPHDEIDYVEAHGTGTDLGDQVELTALAAAFGDVRRKIPVGSLKANIGHLDVAAGVSSVIKGVMVLENGILPPIAHLKQVTDAVPLANARFDFPIRARPESVRNISVSSFGIGGTNAHVVLGRSEPRPAFQPRSLPCYLVPLYLNDAGDGPAYIDNVLASARRGASLLDLAATLSIRRKRRSVVKCCVVTADEDLGAQLLQGMTAGRPDALDVPRFDAPALLGLARELPALQFYAPSSLTTPAQCASALDGFLDALGVFKSARISYDGGLLMAASTVATPLGSTIPPLRRLLEFLAAVHAETDLELSLLYLGTGWRPVSLPAYPLAPVRHWIDLEESSASAPRRDEAPEPMDDDAVLERIVAICNDSIGGDAVTSETSLIDAGGDSLSAVEIVDRINRTFGCGIGVGGSLAQMTPRDLAIQVLGRELRSSAPWISYARFSAAGAKNIFLVHPAGGSTFCYSALGRHLPKRLNICAIDLPESYAGYASMSALARRYAIEIRSFQPEGPYCVGGYSFGGNLAHEIAIELERQACLVEVVVMFDSHPPEAYNSYLGGSLDYVGALPGLMANYFKPELLEATIAESDGVATLEAAVELVRRRGIVNSRLQDEDIKRFFHRWVFTHTLLKEHHPRSLVEAPLLMFVAQEEESALLMDKLKVDTVVKTAWNKYFRGIGAYVDVAGDHFTMFGQTRHVKPLARRFDTAMQEFPLQRTSEARRTLAAPEEPALAVMDNARTEDLHQ
jgi:phthiocerol/phenolphthiocerol synthesis type-I polyketide synthase E